jgi:hypothetical protein
VHAGRRLIVADSADEFFEEVIDPNLHGMYSQPELCEAVVACIEDPLFPNSFRRYFGCKGRGRGNGSFKESLRWLSESHPQEDVRRAASQVAFAPSCGAAMSAVPAAAQPRTDSAEESSEDSAEDPVTQFSSTGGAFSAEDVNKAIERSNEDAAQREIDEVFEVIRIQKAERLNDDLILTRLKGWKPEHTDMVLSSEHLQTQRDMVVASGYPLRPEFGNGAVFLAPCSEQRINESGWASWRLKQHHVLLRASDKESVEQVFIGTAHRKRPKIIQEEFPSLGSDVVAEDATAVKPHIPKLVVEHRVSFLKDDVTLVSDFVQSAPPCPGASSNSENPRMWKPAEDE